MAPTDKPPPRARLPVFSEEGDKYRPTVLPVIDCASRLSLCQARCCKLVFALSRQDVEEGILRWDPEEPHRILQGDDGYCVHYEPGAGACGVHAVRPMPCRVYDCRGDKRIWADFAARVPA